MSASPICAEALEFEEGDASEASVSTVLRCSPEAIGKRIRLVARNRKGEEVAKCSFRLESHSTVRVWLPQISHRVDFSTADAQVVFGEFLRMVDRVAAQLPSVSQIDTKPGEDLPNWPEWSAALTKSSFRAIAAGHIFCRDDRTGGSQPQARAQVHLEQMQEGHRPILVDLVEGVFKDTASRHELAEWSGPSAYVEELVGCCSSLSSSFIAYDQGVPVGYVFADANDVDDDGERQGWIYGLGVLPTRRRNGIARELVRVVLATFAHVNVSKSCAFIDDTNLPSLTLFGSFAFQEQPHSHFIFRKELRPFTVQ